MRKMTRKEFLKTSAATLAAAAINGKGTFAKPTTLPPSNPTMIENTRPGTADWENWEPARNHEIEGYANKTSVGRGEAIRFFVNTVAPTYTIEIFRLGWYEGIGGRRMTNPVQYPGIRQPMPAANPLYGLIECRWTGQHTLTIPTTDWTSGIYVAKLTASNSGLQSYIVFVVRDDNRTANYMFQSSVTTFQAYNNWGGKSLYAYNSTGGRAYRVSFNRPYADGLGTADVINDWSGWELNMLRFLESQGYDLTYCTNIDTHAKANLLNARKAFFSVGHDEYWSAEMRQNIESARGRGVNLGFFTANACYWQVRLANSGTGEANRTMICYKDAYTQDPNYRDVTKRATTTVEWRNPIVNKPENALLGVMYEFYPVNGDIVIDNASHWVFANTGLRNGDRLPGLLGYEADRIFTANSPAGLVRLAHSPLVAETGPGYSDMTLYTHASGAKVFATGSMQWAWGLDDYFGGWSHDYLLNAAAQQITRNVMDRFVS